MLYKKGDKVIPIGKTSGVSFDEWSKGRDGLGTKVQGYTKVTSCDSEQLYCCYHKPELLFISNSGNYFREEDLIPYKVNKI